MQATISCDMTCPWEFHTSHRLGPNMSITCKTADAARFSGASGSLPSSGVQQRGTHLVVSLQLFSNKQGPPPTQ